MAARSAFRKYMPVEVYPIVFVVTGAVIGGSIHLFRLSQGSDVVWDRKSDWRPWDKVKQDQNTKLFSFNPEFWAKRREQVAASNKERLVDQI